MKLADRLNVISESATLKLNALAQKMKSEGVDVVNLTAGEPDFHILEPTKEAAHQAINNNKSRYTPVPGIPELRAAVAKKTNAQQPGQDWKADNVLVSNGGKQALYNTLLALVNPGDEVAMVSPFWLSYPEMTKLAQGTPKVLYPKNRETFKLTAQELREGLTSKTKVLILNSPSNPAGVLYTKEELAEMAGVLKDFPDVIVISDEIYDRIILGDTPFTSFLAAAPDFKDRVVTCNGMSKAHAMTGWRVGWIVASQDLVKAVGRLQGQTTSGVNGVAQWASVEGLGLPESAFSEQVQSYQKRRSLVLETLVKKGKMKVCEPQGAFYAFVSVEAGLNEGEDAVGWCERLLQEAKVAAIPGTPFGEPGFIRISFATDEKSLQEGCDRLVHFYQKTVEEGCS